MRCSGTVTDFACRLGQLYEDRVMRNNPKLYGYISEYVYEGASVSECGCGYIYTKSLL